MTFDARVDHIQALGARACGILVAAPRSHGAREELFRSASTTQRSARMISSRCLKQVPMIVRDGLGQTDGYLIYIGTHDIRQYRASVLRHAPTACRDASLSAGLPYSAG